MYGKKIKLGKKPKIIKKLILYEQKIMTQRKRNLNKLVKLNRGGKKWIYLRGFFDEFGGENNPAGKNLPTIHLVEEERNMNILRILGDLICIINENRKTGKATGDNYFRGEKKQGNKGFLKGGGNYWQTSSL